MLRMKIDMVAFDQSKGAAVVSLVDDSGERKLPLLIGITEAMAIFRELNRTPAARPMAYDLFKNFMDGVQADVEKVVVDTIKEDTYLAWIHFRVGDSKLVSDSRPSDGIVMALKCQAPIYVEDKVLDRAEKIGFLVQEGEEGEPPDLQQWLDDVKPSDFEEGGEEEEDIE